MLDTAIGRDVLSHVSAEMQRAAHRAAPDDPLRRAALVAEEAGEALQAALNLTRPGTAQTDGLKHEFYTEMVQTAAMALRILIAMHMDETGD